MPSLSLSTLTHYLEKLLGSSVHILSIVERDRRELAGDVKSFGYGTPVFIEFEVQGEKRTVVMETVAPSSFGHEHFSDRAQAVLWEHDVFNRLPRHVRSIDCGAFLRNGQMLSTGEAEEFFLLTDFVEGTAYFNDLDRIARSGELSEGDEDRAAALADYLADVHAVKRESPGLYVRRIRELVGHGECIMGLIDNYPSCFEFIGRDMLVSIEQRCLDWRWRIKDRTHRLSRVHGDFHPWNILFRSGVDFTSLDRSRGEWGEPADDATCLSINFLFSSILRYGRLAGPFERLHRVFWDRYHARTADAEMLEVAAPFLAWRGLVLANPVWYPHIPTDARKIIFRFIRNVLAADRYESSDVNRYLL